MSLSPGDLLRFASLADAEVIAAIRAMNVIDASWVVGGAAHDYMTDAAYAPPGLTSQASGPCTSLLGDGVITPNFYGLLTGNVAALARTSTGLRVTQIAVNTAGAGDLLWPYGNAGTPIVVPMPVGTTNVRIDGTFATNIMAVGKATIEPDSIVSELLVVRWADGVAAPDVLGGAILATYPTIFSGDVREGVIFYARPNTYGTATAADRNVSSAGQGTVDGVTSRDFRVVLNGPTVEVWTAPPGGTLVRREQRADPRWLAGRSALAVVFGGVQFVGTPRVGLWVELRSLSITKL